MSTPVPIDADRRERLRAITDRIGALKGQAALVLYELGVLLAEVSHSNLFLDGGYPTLNAYLDAEVELSRATAFKAMRVARHFNAGMVERYGIDKLDAGVRYLELTRTDEQPGDLIAAKLRLRSPAGHYISVPFHEASSRQVREAAKLLSDRRPRVPPEARDRAERVARALQVAEVEARVSARRGRGGAALVSFRDVPVDGLEAFARALLTATQETE